MTMSLEKREHHKGQEHKVKEFFRQSFRFSQGDDVVQNSIFGWLLKKGYLLPSDVQFTERPSFLASFTLPKMHGDTDNPGNNTLAAWESLVDTSVTPELSDENQIVTDILHGVIDADLVFQKRVRPGRTGKVSTPDAPNDPHASFLRKFALMGMPTGTPAFDDLHRDLGILVRKYKNEMGVDFVRYPGSPPDDLADEAKNKLFELEQLWEANHNGGTYPRVPFFV